MKLLASAIILSSLCAAKFWASAFPSPGPAPAPIDGYGVTIPEWEVEVSPGGPTIKLNGTIQEVRRELLKLNPNWDAHYPANITEGEGNITDESPTLNKRNIEVSGSFCFARWPECSVNVIKEGISYLRRVKGYPSRGAGPGNCERVSCSYNSAIWWCNDAPGTKTLLGGYGDIADGAAFLIQRCYYYPYTQNAVIAGQVFSTSDWNVIVRADKC